MERSEITISRLAATASLGLMLPIGAAFAWGESVVEQERPVIYPGFDGLPDPVLGLQANSSHMARSPQWRPQRDDAPVHFGFGEMAAGNAPEIYHSQPRRESRPWGQMVLPSRHRETYREPSRYETRTVSYRYADGLRPTTPYDDHSQWSEPAYRPQRSLQQQDFWAPQREVWQPAAPPGPYWNDTPTYVPW